MFRPRGHDEGPRVFRGAIEDRLSARSSLHAVNYQDGAAMPGRLPLGRIARAWADPLLVEEGASIRSCHSRPWTSPS